MPPAPGPTLPLPFLTPFPPPPLAARRSERVYNTVFRLPYRLEQMLAYAVLLCFDSLLGAAREAGPSRCSRWQQQ